MMYVIMAKLIWQSLAQVDEGIASLKGNEKEIEAALKSRAVYQSE